MVDSVAKRIEDAKIEIIELPAEDLNWSTVSLSEVINKGKRLEASYFGIEYKNAVEVVQKCKFGYSNLQKHKGGLITSYRPGIIKRIFVEPNDNSIPMLTPSQINDIYPKAEKYLSKIMKSKIKDWFVKEGEILLTCSGSIGDLSIVTDTLKNRCISQNLIRMNPIDRNLTGYIYAFLKTETGQTQLQRSNYGAVIKHINPSHLNNILIPNAPTILKKIIHDLVIQSYKNRDESNCLIDRANEILIDELELPPIDELHREAFSHSKEISSFSTRLSELYGRLEGSYHIPVAAVIEGHITKKADVLKLSNKVLTNKIILPGRFKRVYVKQGNGKVFFGGNEIGQLDPTNKKYLSLSRHSERIKNELTLKMNMILVTRSGTVGKVAIVPQHWENCIANEHVLRVESKEPYHGLIYTWLNSEYGKILITRQIYGSVVDEITDEQIGEIIVPIFKDESITVHITELIDKANSLRYEAYKQEQRAIEIMNQEVLGL